MKYISRWAFSLHSWLGLISGIFLLLLGLSGSALVFFKEIDHALHQEQLRVHPKGKILPLDVIYRQIGKSHPRLGGIAWLNPTAQTDEAYEFRLYQNDGKLSTYDLGMLSIDPYSGRVLREGNLKDLSTGLMQWLIQFHWSFQLGIPGLLLATVFGITMVLSTFTGFIIYRKQVWKVLCFKTGIKWDNWRTVSSGLHRVVGVWAMVFNLLIFFTGFWMNKFSFDPAYWKKQTVSMSLNSLSTKSLDGLMESAKGHMPDLMVEKVYLPTQEHKDFKISGRIEGQSAIFGLPNSVSMDPNSGQMTHLKRLDTMGFWDQLEATVFSLHVGDFGGVPVKILYVILGLLPGLLSITGALLWWRRVRRRIIK